MTLLEFLFRWLHVLFGITWIGLLYYFNFVQGEYFKEATPEAKGDAVKKLAPRALWWFRWAAMFTFLTGLALLHFVHAMANMTASAPILVGALAGILMFLNVWLIIWPKQKVVIGLKEGDAAAAGAKAMLASRTNTLFSAPMLFGMLASKHLPLDPSPLGLGLCVALVLALEANALFGKTGPMTSIVGVVHCSLGLAVAVWALLTFL